jgi:hypothetical protein
MEAEVAVAVKTIRSRSNMAVGEIYDNKWKIIAKRIIAEPTPRTGIQAPRFGIYDYDVEPLVVDKQAENLHPRSKEKPLMSSRKVKS